MELQGLARTVLVLLRRNLKKNAREIVEEKVSEVFKLVGVAILLKLADNRAESLRVGKNLNIDRKRFRTRRKRCPTLKRFLERALAVLRSLAVKALTLRRLTIRIVRLFLAELPRGTCFTDDHPGALLGPIGRKVYRAEIQCRYIKIFHRRILYQKLSVL